MESIWLLSCCMLAMTRGMRAEEGEKTEQGLHKATFAGGCFWCMEQPFETLEGVEQVTSGYTGGREEDPTYQEVAHGQTGHTEAVQILFDPAKVAYEQLLDIYWRNVDPTASDRQFVDEGRQYRPEIFYHSEEQRTLAEASKEALARSGRFEGDIVVRITPATAFYAAEDYHQKFYKKNPMHYKTYRFGSGRDEYLEQVWGKSGDHS